MISIKKMFKVYSEVMDVNDFVNKIDNINKQILPKSLLRKKKSDDN